MRALKSGDLRATKDNLGQWSIDSAILDDWLSMRRTGVRYQPPGQADTYAYTPVDTLVTPPSPIQTELDRMRDDRDTARLEAAVLRTENAQLQARLNAAEREHERDQGTVADLRRRLDEEQAERRALQGLLTSTAVTERPMEAPPVVPLGAESSKAQKGFLARLLGF